MVTVREIAGGVPDPELPMLNIAELGILRDAHSRAGTAVVSITPTYTACPALDAIRADIAQALQSRGWPDVEIHTVYSPAWTTDWITPAGRAKLTAAGIAPPGAMNEHSAPPGAMDEHSAPPGAMDEHSAPPGAMDEHSAPRQGEPGGTEPGGTTPAAGEPTDRPTPSDRSRGAATDDRTPAGRRRLPLLSPPAPRCPRCDSVDVEELSRFGPAACLSLWRCRSCAEPFEHLKAH